MNHQNMKLLIFGTTIGAYMTVHIMRMSLPFVQDQIIDYFEITSQVMGLAMASIYILLSISYFFRIFIPIENVQTVYFKTMLLAALSYAILPFVISLNVHNQFFLFLSLAQFGIFQSSSWPTLIKITDKYFKPETDGCLLGIWSSSGDIGNIMGFFICTVIVYYVKLPWFICLFVASFLAIAFAMVIYFLPLENIDELNEPEADENHKSELLNQFMNALKDPVTLCTLGLLCLLKSLIYAILLWLPMYFSKGDFKDFSGYIFMSMSIFAIIGSFSLGSVYEKVSSPKCRSVIFLVTQAILVISFYSLKQLELDIKNKWLFFFLIAISGFNLQGNFNCIMTHESIILSQNHGINIASVSSLFMALGNLSVGLLEIMIGIVISKNSESIFSVFMVVSIICLGLYILRSYLIWKYIPNKAQLEGESIRSEQQS